VRHLLKKRAAIKRIAARNIVNVMQRNYCCPICLIKCSVLKPINVNWYLKNIKINWFENLLHEVNGLNLKFYLSLQRFTLIISRLFKELKPHTRLTSRKRLWFSDSTDLLSQ
jgi:hypothetical protein